MATNTELLYTMPIICHWLLEIDFLSKICEKWRMLNMKKSRKKENKNIKIKRTMNESELKVLRLYLSKELIKLTCSLFKICTFWSIAYVTGLAPSPIYICTFWTLPIFCAKKTSTFLRCRFSDFVSFSMDFKSFRLLFTIFFTSITSRAPCKV